MLFPFESNWFLNTSEPPESGSISLKHLSQNDAAFL